ncbi:hypothetical protein Y032_0048g1640 [Ancylostoma ceylanicum]|uniref:Uncharacterized protein n=1 Tax=Ancylostoma ceylanicum TaxID=53326 RepID=A0A016UA19_9BILA|nr:hypothetical protein Y032_0048g1640 [Ancylostoma ceylanicum]
MVRTVLTPSIHVLSAVTRDGDVMPPEERHCHEERLRGVRSAKVMDRECDFWSRMHTSPRASPPGTGMR